MIDESLPAPLSSPQASGESERSAARAAEDTENEGARGYIRQLRVISVLELGFCLDMSKETCLCSPPLCGDVSCGPASHGAIFAGGVARARACELSRRGALSFHGAA